MYSLPLIVLIPLELFENTWGWSSRNFPCCSAMLPSRVSVQKHACVDDMSYVIRRLVKSSQFMFTPQLLHKCKSVNVI